jgi:cytochrome c oxidase subunit IV
MEASSARIPEQPHGHSLATPHHTVNYLAIFVLLVVLTALTLLVSFYRFQSELVNVLLALLVASIKATFVALYFMHLKFEGKLIYVILFVPLALCILLVVALIPDVYMTDPVRNAASASLHLFNPITAFFHGFGK